MLVLAFSIAGERFGLDVRELRAVVPDVPLRSIPGAVHGIAGLLEHRALAVPVVDIGLLMTGRPAAATLGTRIVLARYRPGPRGARIGLRIESIEETVRVMENEFVDRPLTQPDTPWLDRLARTGDGLIQIVEVSRLLSDMVRASLYPREQPG